MNLTRNLERITTRKTLYTTLYDTPIAKELTEAINKYGMKEVRAYIKQQTGKPCPVIVYLPVEKLYGLRKYCIKVYLNTEYVWVLPHTYTNHESYRITYIGNMEDDTAMFQTEDADIPMYQGKSRTLWIFFGKECLDCGTPFLHYRNNFCPTCIEKRRVRPYNHQVETELGFEEKTSGKYYPTPRYGIELEYEQITSNDVFDTLRNHALPKLDGSIKDGVEIVTKPASIETHKEKLANFFSKVPVKPTENAGMHVHIERDRLSEYQIGFIAQFLNTEELLKENELVAGRNYSKNVYCKVNATERLTSNLYFNFETKKIEREKTQKYSPLNTSKKHTVEIRIFSTPATAEECFAKLDFVSALVQYSSPYSVSIKHLKDKFSWKEFTKFIIEHKKEFNDFHSFYIKSGKVAP